MNEHVRVPTGTSAVGGKPGRAPLRARTRHPADVLLLDEDRVQALVLAHGLASAGCTVEILTATSAMKRSFRAGRVTQTFTGPIGSGAYTEALEARLTGEPSSVVIAVTEPALYDIWRRPLTWQARLFPNTRAWQRRLVTNKWAMAEFMTQSGVTTPAVWTLDAYRANRADIDLPVVVKGVAGGGGAEVHICGSHGEIETALARLTAAGVAGHLQAYIDGPMFVVGGVFDEGRAVRLYGAETIEQFPPRTGPAIRQRTSDDPKLLEAARKAFQALRWTGLGQADFIRSSSDGAYYFLEINPRPWGAMTGAAPAGVDLVGATLDVLMGRPAAPPAGERAGAELLLFPQYLMARGRNARSAPWPLIQSLFDPEAWRGMPLHHPALARHLAAWLTRRYFAWASRGSAAGKAPLSAARVGDMAGS